MLLKVNHKDILKKQSQLIGYDYILPMKTTSECAPVLKCMRSLCQIMIIDCYIQLPVCVAHSQTHSHKPAAHNHCPSHHLPDNKLLFVLILTLSFFLFGFLLPKGIVPLNKMSSFRLIITFFSNDVLLFKDLS